MTELTKLYVKVRTELRCGHRRAVDELARQTGMDPQTIARALARARREDERDEKRRKKEATA